jgi:hypothetical protein
VARWGRSPRSAIWLTYDAPRPNSLSPGVIAWHVARDGLVETIRFLALSGSLGKIGYDVI